MAHFEFPTYIFDFRSAGNCTKTQAIQPGETATVLVRPDNDTQAPGIPAQAHRTADGQLLEISVTTDAGTQTHNWTWVTLIEAIRVHRGTHG